MTHYFLCVIKFSKVIFERPFLAFFPYLKISSGYKLKMSILKCSTICCESFLDRRHWVEKIFNWFKRLILTKWKKSLKDTNSILTKLSKLDLNFISEKNDQQKRNRMTLNPNLNFCWNQRAYSIILLKFKRKHK